jgi:hypothetical protein
MKNFKRIEKAINRLVSGAYINNKTFRQLIGEAEYQEYLDEILSLNKPTSKPVEIKRYEKLLTRACYYNALMEKYGTKYANKADSAFESAWEYAREVVEMDYSLSQWFDRSVFDFASSDPTSIPRIIGSRSFYCSSKIKFPVTNLPKKELKITYLCSRLEELKGANLDNWLEEKSHLVVRKKTGRKFNFEKFKF